MRAIDFADLATRQLHATLVDAYPKESQMEALLRRAGMSPADVPYKETLRDTWQATLIAIDSMARLGDVLSAAMSDPRTTAYHEVLRSFLADTVTVPRPAVAWNLAPAEILADMPALEKIMGVRSTLLDVSFLAAGLDVARAVVKLRMVLGGVAYLGTGFLVASDLVLTNHHNFFDRRGVRASVVEVHLDYELQHSGTLRDLRVVLAACDTITGSADGDWATIRLPDPLDDRRPLVFSERPAAVGDWVAIIQHPQGLPKKIALHHNVVTYSDSNIVHYLADTEPGSSGSPVLNDSWEVVALHHAGGDMLVPGTSRRAFRNEGIDGTKVRIAIGKS